MYKKIRNIIFTILSLICIPLYIITSPLFALFALVNCNKWEDFINQTFEPVITLIKFVIENLHTGFEADI